MRMERGWHGGNGAKSLGQAKVDYAVSPDVQQEITCDYNSQCGAKI